MRRLLLVHPSCLGDRLKVRQLFRDEVRVRRGQPAQHRDRVQIGRQARENLLEMWHEATAVELELRQPPSPLVFDPVELPGGDSLANAACVALAYIWRYEEGFSLAISIMLGEVFVAVLLWMRSGKLRMTGPMKAMLALASALIALDVLSAIGQVGYLIYLVAEAGRLNQPPPSVWKMPLLMTLGKISMSWRIAVGLLGLALLFIGRDRKEAAPSPEPPPQA